MVFYLCGQALIGGGGKTRKHILGKNYDPHSPPPTHKL